MRHGSIIIGIFVAVLALNQSPAGAEVLFSNHWQKVKLFLFGDETVIREDEAQDNGGGDFDCKIFVEDQDLQGYARGQLKTVYEAEKLNVDGRISLKAFRPSESPYTEISAQADVYYQTLITVTDEPVWLKITGYLTPDQNHAANNHFLVGAPEWYWFADYYSGDKVWMVDTALFDVGEHYLYGGVNYTLTVDTEDIDELYADYYFAVEVVGPPVFEPFRADFDGSGRVDLVDFALFASAWLWEEGD